MIKRRIEADGNISYNLTSYADLIAGLRYRTFLLKIDTVGANEIQTGPYAGVRVGFNF